ncbi:hypothetical protein H4Q26_013356 [Puccinia striiformis f. sp. tritici PST-130]|nr:hypothetical protein H4Q26_013356 [Puccinia striiformis f. sp. tritici PST-130]
MFRLIRTATSRNLSGQAYLHVTSHLQAITPLRMPALSPTMEAGQISKWNIKTGEKFQREMCSANNDIKSILVGQVIAVLGDHAEDVQRTINIPVEWNSSNKTPQINKVSSSDNSIDHSHANPHRQVIKTILPLSPAVNRLLHELFKVLKSTYCFLKGCERCNQDQRNRALRKINKGDILAHYKKVSSPLGTANKMIQADADARLAERSQLGSLATSTTKSTQAQVLEPLLPEAVRLFITEGLSDLTTRPSSSSTNTTASTSSPTFESILNITFFPHSSSLLTPSHKSLLSHTSKSGSDLNKYFHGFL